MTEIAKRYTALLDEAYNRKLVIIVWGPGAPDKDPDESAKLRYEKRLKMKRSIEAKFPRAEVYFSEDLKDLVKNPSFNILDEEVVHSALSDGVIALFISHGVYVEINAFVPAYSWIRDKVHILIPSEYVDDPGIQQTVLRMVPPNQIRSYLPTEYDECIVASEKAVQIVEKIAIEKIMKLAGITRF